jgi:two-component system sensor histidine kinase and response regulator WspE
VVDRFLGERELVVQPLDPRLGKIKDIAAAAVMEDGAPLLIVDVEDMVRSVEKLISGGRLSKVHRATAADEATPRKRVLVVDDSLTVRELERKLLASRGYEVEVAVDGMDGWNAVRTGHFNLVVSDIDMPRMDGIELVTLIKKEPSLKSLPVMIVSYKDREEDRRRGLDAGADYYLTKGSFHDETLLQAVVDLIGEATP